MISLRAYGVRMGKSPDHPELEFVQAKAYGEGRAGLKVLWIVVHDMEAGEYSGRAESTAQYFATLPDGRVVSSHYTVDNDSVVQCVLLKDSAWTVGNTPGNRQGINWELAGFARQTRAEWLDPFGVSMFNQMAPIIRADAKRFGIPLEKRTREELVARKPGITSHADLAAVFGGSDHTDPGTAFPWDVFIQTMRTGGQKETDMFMFSVEGEEPNHLWLTDGFVRRAFDASDSSAPYRAAGVPQIAPVKPRAGESPEQCLTRVGGPLWRPDLGGAPVNYRILLEGSATPDI